MDGFQALYAVMANAGEKTEDAFFIGRITGTEPVTAEGFGLPLDGAVFVRGLPEMQTGDSVLGVIIAGRPYILAVL